MRTLRTASKANPALVPSLLVALACLGGGSGAADQPSPPSVPVGDSAVDGSFLKPYDNVWRFSVETVAEGVDHFQGLWTDHLQAVQKDGKSLFQRAQGMTYVDGRTTSVVNVFDPKTLAPVSSESRNPDGSFLHRDFKGAHVEYRRVASPGAKEETGAFDLPSPVFDFAGGMYGLLLAGFPLKEGYSASFTAVDEYEGKIQPVTFKVVRTESVVAGSKGKVQAFVVEAEGGFTFWLTREPPYIIRLIMVGPRKNIAKWEMLPS